MPEYKPIDHELRYCQDCEDNTCCRSDNGQPWRCRCAVAPEPPSP